MASGLQNKRATLGGWGESPDTSALPTPGPSSAWSSEHSTGYGPCPPPSAWPQQVHSNEQPAPARDMEPDPTPHSPRSRGSQSLAQNPEPHHPGLGGRTPVHSLLTTDAGPHCTEPLKVITGSGHSPQTNTNGPGQRKGSPSTAEAHPTHPAYLYVISETTL